MKEVIRAAFVIARRDFMAIIKSKAFFFFLLGPLFPLAVGLAAGAVGSSAVRDDGAPIIGVAMDKVSYDKLSAARADLTAALPSTWMPELEALPDGASDNPQKWLSRKDKPLTGVLTGTLSDPVLTGTGLNGTSAQEKTALLIGMAREGTSANSAKLEVRDIGGSADAVRSARLITAQAGQSLLFLLTMLLAGMVLSNMVEEKSNKIIEILAAAIPLDSVFLGKLFAMLAMAMVGIVIWGTGGLAGAIAMGANLPDLPAPAVGWSAFIILNVIYFSTAYLILGAIFLGIGSLANSVREVQTLSMPVTMSQLVVFFYAMYVLPKMGEPAEIAATIIPPVSPFAMVARAAQDDRLWIHGVAIIGQLLFVLLVLRIGVLMFKRNVLKSGKTGGFVAAMKGAWSR